MKCIAIWCSNISKQTSSTLEVHFNLWKLKKNRKTYCFLDIGLMVQNVADVSHINIFVPESIQRRDLEDLGIIFREKTDLVSSLFNEDHRVSSRATQKFLEVIDDSGESVFHMHVLDIENDINIENAYNGSILRIKLPEETFTTSHYFRIRLTNPYVESIS
jgi:hypothetical protein